MSRAKRGFKRRHRRSKIRDRAEGFLIGRRTEFRRMSEAVDRARVYEYRDRRVRKRSFRELWVGRLSAAAVANNMSYSRMIAAMTKSKVGLNRKMLSEIAIHDPSGFTAIIEQVRSAAPAI
ncbi:MAG: 50S ribosomal protein L20 [Bacteriovoracia bacterium]